MRLIAMFVAMPLVAGARADDLTLADKPSLQYQVSPNSLLVPRDVAIKDGLKIREAAKK